LDVIRQLPDNAPLLMDNVAILLAAWKSVNCKSFIVVGLFVETAYNDNDKPGAPACKSCN
jgi:hypothetical protein